MWALAAAIYLAAAALAFALTRRTRDAAEALRRRNGEPAGFERLRGLMAEVEETRRREQANGEPELPFARDPEGRPAP